MRSHVLWSRLTSFFYDGDWNAQNPMCLSLYPDRISTGSNSHSNIRRRVPHGFQPDDVWDGKNFPALLRDKVRHLLE